VSELLHRPAAAAAPRRPEVRVERVEARAFEIATDGPGGTELDGTLEWESTTIVVVEAHAGGRVGIGYTYGDRSLVQLIRSQLARRAEGADALAPTLLWLKLSASLRNAGRPGAGFMALSALDSALWDLKARLLDLPLIELLPAAHEQVLVYGSGGFCNYPLTRLQEQLAGWVKAGIPRVKLKIGRAPREDAARLAAAREVVGGETELYVDANGAFTRKQALDWANRLTGEWGVSWFEEPVSSADAAGLRLLRDRGPAGLEIAAGEYAFVPADFRNLIDSVDCLQADVTRCGGITGLLAVAGLSAVHGLDLSAHCAPQLSAHAFCAVQRARHIELFHDHDRVERLLFDGVLEPVDGALRPDRSRSGNGLELKMADARRYAV
jgi:L-alanine-DL-glutamate epimerase-like enolase superfamily enzyme